MHTQVKEYFENRQYFGFTGTPRLRENKSGDGRTTADLFDKCLHHYLIRDVIHDNNVLGFLVTYINTLGAKLDEISAEKVQVINTKEVWQSDNRIDLIVNQ